jgi:hypothetical protein
MRRHLKIAAGIMGIAVGAIVLLLLLTSPFRPLRAEVHGGWIEWTPLRSSSPSVIKIDPKRHWVAQMERGWIGWLKVWELRGDLTIGEKVLEIGGKGHGFFVRDIEWVGESLLISIVKGYDTLLEWDKKAEEVIDEEGRSTLRFGLRKPWEVRWLIFDPKTHQLVDWGINMDLLGGELFAHPAGDRVLIVKAREGGAFGIRKIKVVSLPTTSFGPPEVKGELSFSYRQIGRFLLPFEWSPDGNYFWAFGTDERGFVKLFSIWMDGSIKKLTPDDHWLLHFGGDVYGKLPLLIDEVPTILHRDNKRCLTVMSSRAQRHVCIGYYSSQRLEKERVIVGWKEVVPEPIRSLGLCTLIAIVPDGRRLILQEGRDAPYGEKRRIWVWDIEEGTVTPLAQVGWITQVYGWLGDEWMVAEMKGEPIQEEIEHDISGKWIGQKATYEYGVIHVP